MTSLLGAEFVKLRHRWMPRILVLIMLGIIALFFWGIGTTSVRHDLLWPRGLLAALTFAGFFAPFLWPVLAGAWTGNEYSWGTIRMVLSRKPNRIEQSIAGLVAVMICVVVALILAVVLGIVAGFVVGALTGHPTSTAGLGSDFPLVFVKGFLAEMYSISFYVVVAYAAGTIFQSAAVGIGVGIGEWIAQEIVRGIFSALGNTWLHVAQHLPNAYTAALPERIMSKDLGGRFANVGIGQPGIVESIIGLAIYLAVLIALTLLFVSRADVTS